MSAKQTTIDFKIVTPDGVVYADDIDRVTIPTQAGEVTILANHAPLVSILKAGELLVRKGSDIVALAVSSGIIEIRPDSKVYIMADTAERPEDIDVAAAEKARARAEELLKKQAEVEDVDFARIQAMMERELARLNVANKYRK